MIVTLLFIIMTLLGIIIIKKSDISDDRYIAGAIMTTFGISFLIISLGIIAVIHVNADKYIQENRIEYEGLCKRYDIIKSDTENAFKLDVIKDITEWNKRVCSAKYWSENLWVNWFYPKRVTDNLYYIPLDEE